MLVDAHPGNDPGPLVQEYDTLTTRLQGQIMLRPK